MDQSLLTIDDSSEIQEAVELHMADDDLRHYHACDGAQGVAMAVSLRPDLILLDVIMPGASGFDVCRQLKSNPLTASIPVIFLSGASDTFNKVQGLGLGAVDYVTKPFDADELRARVGAALRSKRHQDILSERAQIDALTSLRNRAYFDTMLSQEVLAAHRYGRFMSIVLFDVDHFKRINDTHGHPFGDLVLRQLAKLLVASVRECDAACRYGGEEFSLILTETDLRAAHLIAERVREDVSSLRLAQDEALIEFTVSGGVASTTQFVQRDALTPESLLKAADSALYEAKLAGRNRTIVATVATDGGKGLPPAGSTAITTVPL
ncbi:MAG TPA: diguanylate cyclase [Pirellulales bacterium]|nr:diguanylate cyclase [Pirellulales bacterium]